MQEIFDPQIVNWPVYLQENLENLGQQRWKIFLEKVEDTAAKILWSGCSCSERACNGLTEFEG